MDNRTLCVGRSNFWGANASVVLDETNNRFSPTYAPIMDRLLRGECTLADVDAINSRVINSPTRLEDGSIGKISMKDCWMAQTITFRNKARTILLPTCIFIHQKCVFVLKMFTTISLTHCIHLLHIHLLSGQHGLDHANYALTLRGAGHCLLRHQSVRSVHWFGI